MTLMPFIGRKLWSGLWIVWGVVTLIFLLFNGLPGDPARMLLGQRSDPEAIKAIRHDLGLDQPLTVQYLLYLNDISPLSLHRAKPSASALYFDTAKYAALSVFPAGDFLLAVKQPYLRRSYTSKRPVTEIIAETLPQTAILALVSMLFASVTGIFLGAISALKKDTLIDHFFLVTTTLGVAGPSFFMAVLFAWLFGYKWADYTGLGMTGSLYEIDNFGNGIQICWSHLVLPALTLGIRPLSVVLQLSRSSFLDVLSQDYIRTAKAKGAGKFNILWHHALRNALNPVVTAISGWLAGMLAGAVFVEYIFGWKGIGREMVDALENYDFPVIMGAVLIIAIFFVIINIITDIIYSIIDPRITVN